MKETHFMHGREKENIWDRHPRHPRHPRHSQTFQHLTNIWRNVQFPAIRYTSLHVPSIFSRFELRYLLLQWFPLGWCSTCPASLSELTVRSGFQSSQIRMIWTCTLMYSLRMFKMQMSFSVSRRLVLRESWCFTVVGCSWTCSCQKSNKTHEWGKQLLSIEHNRAPILDFPHLFPVVQPIC